MAKKTTLDVTIKRQNVCLEHPMRYCVVIDGDVFYEHSYSDAVKLVIRILLRDEL